MTGADEYELVATTTRNGVIESCHRGAGIALRADGSVAAAIGNPDLVVYPRSANKPFQAAALLDLGLDVATDELAVVCASHSGCPEHLERVDRLLAGCGLGEDDLRNTPGLPLNEAAAAEVLRRGAGPAPRYHNCSGKHAGMLATCVRRGWDLETYLAEDHPVQQHITRMITDVADGQVPHVGVDGCGAPAHLLSLRQLARGFATLAVQPVGSSGGRVVEAMRRHPELVGGPARGATVFMQAIPGLVAKDGAEGVFAAALADGGAVALKIADGAGRARPIVLAALLGVLGADVAPAEAAWAVPILGHGRPVGQVCLAGRPAEWSTAPVPAGFGP